MRKIVSTFGLMAALLLMVTSTATAAPNNVNNTDDVIALDCDEPIGAVAVRPGPGNGNPAWNVETGENYVAKQFSGTDQITVTIVDGDSVSATFEFLDDRGASAPADGRSDLVECTTTFDFSDGPFPIDAEFAETLNAEFETDIFEAGQEITITFESTLTVLVLVPGG